MEQEKMISCCGMVCNECQYYLEEECVGCARLQGRVFWTRFVNEEVCSIYSCCVGEKQHLHCGVCGQQPCARWGDHADPDVTEEEAAIILQHQLDLLQELTS